MRRGTLGVDGGHLVSRHARADGRGDHSGVVEGVDSRSESLRASRVGSMDFGRSPTSGTFGGMRGPGRGSCGEVCATPPTPRSCVPPRPPDSVLICNSAWWTPSTAGRKVTRSAHAPSGGEPILAAIVQVPRSRRKLSAPSPTIDTAAIFCSRRAKKKKPRVFESPGAMAPKSSARAQPPSVAGEHVNWARPAPLRSWWPARPRRPCRVCPCPRHRSSACRHRRARSCPFRVSRAFRPCGPRTNADSSARPRPARRYRRREVSRASRQMPWDRRHCRRWSCRRRHMLRSSPRLQPRPACLPRSSPCGASSPAVIKRCAAAYAISHSKSVDSECARAGLPPLRVDNWSYYLSVLRNRPKDPGRNKCAVWAPDPGMPGAARERRRAPARRASRVVTGASGGCPNRALIHARVLRSDPGIDSATTCAPRPSVRQPHCIDRRTGFSGSSRLPSRPP